MALYPASKQRLRVQQYLPKPVTNPDLREIEDRYTAFDSNIGNKARRRYLFRGVQGNGRGKQNCRSLVPAAIVEPLH